MRKMRDFKCGSCGKSYRKLVDDDVMAVECECGKKAARTLSAPRCFGNTTGKSPSSKY